MRFRRWPRVEPYVDTSRKRAAFHRSQRQKREKLPLFAELIAETQHDVDTEMARRAVWWPAQQQEGRDRRAAEWRRARARLFARGGNVRARLTELWRTCPYPADPVYLHGLLTDFDRGRLDLDAPPWTPKALQPRTTPNPARFDEAFRQIGRRQVGGGPKTTPADELLFCGNLGSGIIFLTSRVRLIEPNESFYTPSNMRLRDSHVGRAGHWVDIVVRGDCSDADLALIARLARDADERPIRVRRACDLPDREVLP